MLPATVKDNFIDLLMETGNVSNVARTLGINRMTAYGWRADPAFADAWDLALEVARQSLRERVVETATALGLGGWASVIDPATGGPELDDEFEPVVRFETENVDARVLMKWMDKTLSDSPTIRVDAGSVRVREQLDLEDVPSDQLRLLLALLGKRIAATDAVDAECVEVDADA